MAAGGHLSAVLLGTLFILAGALGECINEDDNDMISLLFKKQDKMQDAMNEMREKMAGMQVDMAGLREKLHSQEEIHKFKTERMEEKLTQIYNKPSQAIDCVSNNESSLASAVLQLSNTFENLQRYKGGEEKQSQDQFTDEMSKLIAPIGPTSKTNMSKLTTDIDILTNGLNEIRTTVEDLRTKVDNLAAYDSESDSELATRDNTTVTTTEYKGLDQVWAVLQGLQVKVDELAESRQYEFTNNQTIYNNTRKPRYCHDIYIQGERQDGVYKIYPGWFLTHSVNVWCEFDVGHEVGWTRILSRTPIEDPVNFTRSWDDYKDGFGDAHNEYWIGLSVLYEIMHSHCNQVLQVDLQSWDQTSRHAQYKDLSIGNEESGFKLSIGGYSGDAGNAMTNHNAMKFTTIDKDNDNWGSNCALSASYGGGGGFWYNNCASVYVVRELRKKGDGLGMRWNTWSSGNLKKIIFKISPRLPTLI